MSGIVQSVAWHYTTRKRFAEMKLCGFLRPASNTEYEEIVWFSTESFWERTAARNHAKSSSQLPRAKSSSMMLEEMAELARAEAGLVRLGVSLPSGKLLCWLDALEAAGFPMMTRSLLETLDDQQGGDKKERHFGSVGKPILLAEVDVIEFFDWGSRRWVSTEDDIQIMPHASIDGVQSPT